MTPVLIVLLVWAGAGVVVAAVVARALRVRDDRDPRDGRGGAAGVPLIDLTTLPQAEAWRAPGSGATSSGPVPRTAVPGAGSTELPRTG